jgi:hypothetical protein
VRTKGLVTNPEGQKPLEENVPRMGYLLSGAEVRGLSLCGSEYAPVDGRFEHGDEPAGSSFIGMFLVNT